MNGPKTFASIHFALSEQTCLLPANKGLIMPNAMVCGAFDGDNQVCVAVASTEGNIFVVKQSLGSRVWTEAAGLGCIISLLTVRARNRDLVVAVSSDRFFTLLDFFAGSIWRSRVEPIVEASCACSHDISDGLSEVVIGSHAGRVVMYRLAFDVEHQRCSGPIVQDEWRLDYGVEDVCCVQNQHSGDKYVLASLQRAPHQETGCVVMLREGGKVRKLAVPTWHASLTMQSAMPFLTTSSLSSQSLMNASFNVSDIYDYDNDAVVSTVEGNNNTSNNNNNSGGNSNPNLVSTSKSSSNFSFTPCKTKVMSADHNLFVSVYMDGKACVFDENGVVVLSVDLMQCMSHTVSDDPIFHFLTSDQLLRSSNDSSCVACSFSGHTWFFDREGNVLSFQMNHCDEGIVSFSVYKGHLGETLLVYLTNAGEILFYPTDLTCYECRLLSQHAQKVVQDHKFWGALPTAKQRSQLIDYALHRTVK